jgi:hypothetical protein
MPNRYHLLVFRSITNDVRPNWRERAQALAVWVFALSLPPAVAASFTSVKITEAGLSRLAAKLLAVFKAPAGCGKTRWGRVHRADRPGFCLDPGGKRSC